MRQRLATPSGAVPRRRRLPHVARDDVRLHPDADAGHQDRDLPAGTTSRATGTWRATISAARSPSSPTTRRPRCWPRCAPTRRRWASCRRRSRPTPRRGGRCWRAAMPTLPNIVARLPFLVMPNARARGISGLRAGAHGARGKRRRPRPDRRSSRWAASAATASAGALAKAGLPAFTSVLDQLAGGVHHYLVELPGVIADSDPRLRELEAALELENGRVAAIGAYAVPSTARA